LCSCLEGGNFIGGFPREGRLVAAEMAECGSLLVDGAAQVQVIDDALGRQREIFPDQSGHLRFRDGPGAKAVHHDGDRFGNADGIRQLDFGALGQTGCDEILGDIAGHVAGRAVHFRRVLARERAAAVTTHSAVGVDNDFAAGEAGIPMRPTDHKAARRVDVVLGVGIHQVLGDDRVDDQLADLSPQFLGGNMIAVLGGNDDGVDPLGLAINILNAHLGLAVGTEEIDQPGFADFGKPPRQSVSQHDRQRHQFRRFIAGVTEHETLIAGSSGIHAHGDIRRLALNGIQHAAGLAIKAKVRVGVTHLFDRLPRNSGNIDITGSRDLPGYDTNAGGNQHLAGDAAVGILLEDSI
jgi:hypothetical protein